MAVFTTFKWVLSFLAFDRTTTRPEEEINIPALIDSFSNPEIVGGNIVTQVAFILGRVSKLSSLCAHPKPSQSGYYEYQHSYLISDYSVDCGHGLSHPVLDGRIRKF